MIGFRRRFTEVLLAACLCVPLALAEEIGEDELPEPIDFGADPILGGKIKFLDPTAGEHYRDGLARLKYRAFEKAYSEFRAGRKLVKEPSEVEIFERLLREADAGKELERIRASSDRKGRAAKPAAIRAIRTIDKALPDMDGLVLKPEYEKLRRELHARIYLVIDDFEERGTEGETKGDSGAKEGEDAADDGDSGSPFGRFGRFGRDLKKYLDTGEAQSAAGDPETVREGDRSYRWRVGHDDYQLKLYKLDPGTFKEFSYLDLSVRGSARGTTQMKIILAHENLNLAVLAFRPSAYRGYEKDVQIRGKTWKDLRLRIGKDLRPHDSPQPSRIGTLLLLIRKQQDEQVIYLDDIKLER